MESRAHSHTPIPHPAISAPTAEVPNLTPIPSQTRGSVGPPVAVAKASAPTTGATAQRSEEAVAKAGTEAKVNADTSGGTRPTVGGKTLEMIEKTRKTVRLQVKRKADADDEEEEEEEEEGEEEMDQLSGSEYEMEVDSPRKPTRSQRRPKKRRRIVSAKMINSDGEEVLPEEDGWPTVLSRRSCEACATLGRQCRVYKIQPRGRQRFACQWCKFLKKGCSDKVPRQREVASILASRRLAMLRKRAKKVEEDDEDDEDDEDEEEEDDEEKEKKDGGKKELERGKKNKPTGKKGKRESSGDGERSRRRSQQRRQEQSQQRRTERSQQRRPEQSQQRHLASRKDKGDKDGEDGSQATKKYKGKGKAKDSEADGDAKMELDTSTLPRKVELEEDLEWQTGQFSYGKIQLCY